MYPVIIDRQIKKLREKNDDEINLLLENYLLKEKEIMEKYDKICENICGKVRTNRMLVKRNRELKDIFKEIFNNILSKLEQKNYYREYYLNVIKKNREQKIMNECLLIKDIYEKYDKIAEGLSSNKKQALFKKRTEEIKKIIGKRTIRKRKNIEEKIKNYKNINKKKEDIVTEKDIEDIVTEKRYRILDIALDNLIHKDNLMSILISGQPGTGKTYQIIQKLSTTLVNGKFLQENFDYINISGTATAKELYDILYKYKEDKILIFDDCDSIIVDEKSISILKLALDNTKQRKISWIKSKAYCEEVESFIFSSKIIIITNILQKKINTSLLTRAMFFNLWLTNKQILNRARKLKYELMPNINDEIREKVINIIDRHKDSIHNLSLRTFARANSLINDDMTEKDIEDIVLYFL